MVLKGRIGVGVTPPRTTLIGSLSAPRSNLFPQLRRILDRVVGTWCGLLTRRGKDLPPRRLMPALGASSKKR